MAAPHLSGYQCQFVDNVDDYECPLCLHVTREPHQTSCCGQDFCQACINRVLTDNKPCPFCKESGFTIFLDKKQKRRVLGLKVVCSNKADGCDWVGSLGDLDSHLSVANGNCQFVNVNCSNNCGEAIQRKLLAGHLANDCLERPYSCKYCELEATFEEIRDTHLPVCTKYPVQCPNNCQDCSLERGQLEQHIKECPLQVVECELKEMGCDVEIQRKDISKHMEESMSRHFRVMAVYSFKVNEQAQKATQSLKQENEDLKKNLTEHTKSLNDTNQKLATTKRDLSTVEGKLERTTRQLSEKEREINDLREQVKQIERLTGTTTFMIFNFSKHKQRGGRWEEGPVFYTFPTRYKMKVNLYIMSYQIDVELTNLSGSRVCCIMEITMFNQVGNFGHYINSGYMEVNNGTYNDSVKIPYGNIESPSRGVQYLVNDSLRFKVDVRL